MRYQLVLHNDREQGASLRVLRWTEVPYHWPVMDAQTGVSGFRCQAGGQSDNGWLQDAGRQSWRSCVCLQRWHSAELPAEGPAGHDAGHLRPNCAACLHWHAGEPCSPSDMTRKPLEPPQLREARMCYLEALEHRIITKVRLTLSLQVLRLYL